MVLVTEIIFFCGGVSKISHSGVFNCLTQSLKRVVIAKNVESKGNAAKKAQQIESDTKDSRRSSKKGANGRTFAPLLRPTDINNVGEVVAQFSSGRPVRQLQQSLCAAYPGCYTHMVSTEYADLTIYMLNQA